MTKDHREGTGGAMQSGLRRAGMGLAVGAMLGALSLTTASAADFDQAKWDEIVAAAKVEGSVTVYSNVVSPVWTEISNGFRAKYPEILVQNLQAPDSGLLPRIEQERAGGAAGADVYVGGEFLWMVDRSREGKVLPLIGPASVNWPERFNTEGIVVGEMEPYIIPYNTELVNPPPKTYLDLLDPKLKGRIAVPISASASTAEFNDILMQNYGSDYLERLAAQDTRLYDGSQAVAQAVASGEMAIGLFSLGSTVSLLKAQGAPIDYVVSPPTKATRRSIVGLGWATHPNAAMVFVDYLMSVDGQSIWHNNGVTASPIGAGNGPSPDSMTPGNPFNYPPEKVAEILAYWDSLFRK